MSEQAARKTRFRVPVDGHPLRARDVLEAHTLARDLLWADYFGITEDRDVWLASRAHARRDLLWLCRHVLGLSRLSPVLHRPAADFCMGIFTYPRYGFGNFRDPRGNGKSSIGSRGGPLWIAIQDPIECIERGWPIVGRESRLGLSTLRSEFTKEFLLLLLGDLENDSLRSLFPEIYPEKAQRWGVTNGIDLAHGIPGDLQRHPLFSTYPRMTRFLDPTIAGGSLEAGRAGAHTHGEIVDDPVNEKTWNSEVNIRNAIHGVNQLFNIIRPERGFRLIIGNDWCPQDVNDHFDSQRVWRVFMRSATACETCRSGYPVDDSGIPLKQANGRPEHQHSGPTFVNLMPESDGKTPDLAQIKKSCGSIHIYLAQYENDPIDPAATCWQSSELPRYEVIEFRSTSQLNPKCLIKFPDPRPASQALPPEERFMVCRVSDLEISLAFDPSHGGEEQDSSEAAITVMGRTPVDTFCWLATFARQGDPMSMLGELIEQVIYWKVRRIAVESVGYQHIIRPLLQREFESRNINWLNFENDIIAVPVNRSDGPKKGRIRDALNPLINSSSLLVSEHMLGFGQSMLQLDGFPVRKPWDILDSLTLHSHTWERVPFAPVLKREIRLKHYLNRRKQSRSQGTAYGWGPSR